MTEQEPVQTSTGAVHNVELHQGRFPSVVRPIRHDTRTSIDSVMCTPLAPGFYKIPFHGNCPRCHHRHVAAEVKVHITTSSTRPSYVKCERCQEKWVALGGPNSTCISLLSTLTAETDPDQVDISARNAIIDMVRGMSSVASRVLTTVPEVNITHDDTGATESPKSRGQQPHEPSTIDLGGEQTKIHSALGEPTHQRPTHLPVQSRAHSTHSAAVSSNRTAVSNKELQNKTFIGKLKRLRKLKDHFPVLQRFIPKGLRRGSKDPKSTTKGHGKVPIHTPNAELADALGGLAGPTLQNNNQSIIRSTKIIIKSDPERVRDTKENENLIHEARKKLTELKHRSERDDVHQSLSIRTQSAQTSHVSTFISQHQLDGRTSQSELLLIGSHLLEVLPPGGETYNQTLSISNDSGTHTSQAETALNSESMTATSGPPYPPYQEISYGGSSPRSLADDAVQPASLHNSHIRQSMSQGDTDTRSFDGSYSVGGPVRSFGDPESHHLDGYSTPIVVQNSTIYPVSLSMIEPPQATTRSRSFSTTTSHANGHRTSDEVSRT